MRSLLRRLFTPTHQASQASDVYIALVTQSRNAFFYAQLGVPDTLDGRHEMLLVHLFLLQQRLHAEPERQECLRDLAETHFSHMDQSLREMGVGDTGVGRRIRAMAEAYFGRMQAYRTALHDRSALEEALARNVYATTSIQPDQVSRLASYMNDSVTLLADQDSEALIHGTIRFAPLPAN